LENNAKIGLQINSVYGIIYEDTSGGIADVDGIHYLAVRATLPAPPAGDAGKNGQVPSPGTLRFNPVTHLAQPKVSTPS
jgi:hypothetical protein